MGGLTLGETGTGDPVVRGRLVDAGIGIEIATGDDDVAALCEVVGPGELRLVQPARAVEVHDDGVRARGLGAVDRDEMRCAVRPDHAQPGGGNGEGAGGWEHRREAQAVHDCGRNHGPRGGRGRRRSRFRELRLGRRSGVGRGATGEECQGCDRRREGGGVQTATPHLTFSSRSMAHAFARACRRFYRTDAWRRGMC